MTSIDLTAAMQQAKVQRPDLASRIDKAADILRQHFTCPEARIIVARLTADNGAVFSVKGSGLSVYQTTDSTCTCKDAQRGNVCKHRLAVRGMMRLMGMMPAPIPVKVARREWLEELDR